MAFLHPNYVSSAMQNVFEVLHYETSDLGMYVLNTCHCIIISPITIIINISSRLKGLRLTYLKFWN